jgi:parallel beta-helix repeat protein
MVKAQHPCSGRSSAHFCLVVIMMRYLLYRLFRHSGALFLTLIGLSLISAGIAFGAATYYIAADGSDTNDGLSSATPWRTIDKINSLGKSLADNSSFLFRRGDVFRGEIRLAESTVNATLAAYGTGENPVISGSVAITGWRPYNGNIYVADVSSLIPPTEKIEQLFVNNQRVLLARYPNVGQALPDPNEGWLEVATSSNKSSFQDPVLGGYNKPNTYWVGGNVRIRTFSWLFETRTVTASTNAGSITLNSDLTQTLAAFIQPGWGYYLDNIFGELDHENEWYFDATTRKVYLYAPDGADPNTLLIEGAIHDVGCSLIWHYHGTKIEDLTFRHQNVDGVNINQSDRVEIRRCRFENIGHTGINMAWNSLDLTVDNNQFSDILEFGIKFIATTDGGGWNPGTSRLNNNFIGNTAIVAGYGGSGVAVACGIRTYGVRGLTISGNRIENTGYVGIHLEGGGHLVEHNQISRALLTLDDGGGIFVNSPDNIIRGNIVTDTWGNRGPSSGTHNGGNFDNNQMGMGIFFQPDLAGNVVENNTFANNRSHGIYPDRARNTFVRNNVCYNNGSGAYQGSQLYLTGSNGVTHNIALSGNVLASNTLSQLVMRTDTSYAIGSYDNAVLCNPYKAASIRNGSSELTLPQWQASEAARDSNAIGCPPLTEPQSHILINRGDTPKTFALGFGSFYDATGLETGAEVVVPAYFSQIIFQSQAQFYSLTTLITILQVLAGQDGPALELLDIDGNGVVGLADALRLYAQLGQ